MERRHVDAIATLGLGGDGRGGGRAGGMRVVSVQHAMEEAVAAAVVRMATLGHRPDVRSDEEGARQTVGGGARRATKVDGGDAAREGGAQRVGQRGVARASRSELEREPLALNDRDALEVTARAHGCEELKLRAERRREAAARLTHRRFRLGDLSRRRRRRLAQRLGQLKERRLDRTKE